MTIYQTKKYELGRGADPYWSRSSEHDSEEELRRHKRVPDKPCVHCGNVFSTNYREPTGTRLREHNHCLSCDIWLSNIDVKEKHKKIIIDGTKYSDNGEVPLGTQGFLGHGGREFTIEFNDGEILTTNNLWCQVDVPEHFKDKLPNNAKFI